MVSTEVDLLQVQLYCLGQFYYRVSPFMALHFLNFLAELTENVRIEVNKNNATAKLLIAGWCRTNLSHEINCDIYTVESCYKCRVISTESD